MSDLLLTPAEKRRKIRARKTQITSAMSPTSTSGVTAPTSLSKSEEQFGLQGKWEDRPLTPAESAYKLPGTARPVKATDRARRVPGLVQKATASPGRVQPISKYRMATFPEQPLAGTGQPVTESSLRQRIKQNMETVRWGPIGATTDSGGGGDFGRISGDVRWMDPHSAYARANPFAGLGLSDKRRAELRREAKFDETMGRYGNKFGGQISSAYFGTPGMAGKELDKTVSALQARAQQGVARMRAEADKSVAEIGAEAIASRPGTPTMPYQAVESERGEARILNKQTGEVRPMVSLPPEVESAIRKIRSKDELLNFYRDQDTKTRSLIKKYFGG